MWRSWNMEVLQIPESRDFLEHLESPLKHRPFTHEWGVKKMSFLYKSGRFIQFLRLLVNISLAARQWRVLELEASQNPLVRGLKRLCEVWSKRLCEALETLNLPGALPRFVLKGFKVRHKASCLEASFRSQTKSLVTWPTFLWSLSESDDQLVVPR